jgi:hypothetical protein
MVPYQSSRRVRSTTFTTCSSYTSTCPDYDNDPYEDGDWVTFTFSNYSDLDIPLPKEKPVFDRVMKMRNTDGKPMKRFIPVPLKMWGRDNIGVRNYKKEAI